MDNALNCIHRIVRTEIDGRVRTAGLGAVDKSFGRAQLGAQWRVTEQLGVFAEANSRFAHDEGNQAGYSLGVQWLF